MSEEKPLGEKTRTCPSCRCTISVLATKCRYCGESVGKPKEEARKLSINDLGGENIQHRALSSSVMDALESFRIEDAKDGDAGEGADVDDLNFDGLDTSGIDDPYNQSPLSSSSTVVPPASSSGGLNFGLIAKIAAAIIVIGGIAAFAPSYFQKNVEVPSDARPSEFVNRAPLILEQTGDSLAALEVAVQAMNDHPGANQTQIADDVMAAVVGDIEAQLNAEPWSPENLREATRMATAAAQLFPGKQSSDIKSIVEAEEEAYSMILVDIDPSTRQAEYKLASPGKPVEFAKQGAMISDRFRVVSMVGDKLKLEDMKRDGRDLVWQVGRNPN